MEPVTFSKELATLIRLTWHLCHEVVVSSQLRADLQHVSDNLARLWCVETGEIKREYSGHQKAVVCLAFNDSVLG